MKLQGAYVAEKNMYGGWKLIGYSGPGENSTTAASSQTTNFIYGSDQDYTAETNGDVSDAWTATSRAKLNDCDAGQHWQIATVAVADNGADSYNATTDCAELTPNFAKIGGTN